VIAMNDIDFLVIGAAKSATTWLQRCMQADPTVHVPDPELHYFSREYERGHDWYCAQYTPQPGTVLIGEKSNSYLDTPPSMERIAKDLPHVKLIAQLRNPVDRAYSDYCMHYRRGDVGRDINRYIDPRGPRESRILPAGLYSQQLATVYDLFPADRILVTFFENIKTGPAEQLTRVRDFLGLPRMPAETFLQPKVKDKTTPMLPPALRRLLAPVKPMVKPLRSSSAFKTLHGMFASEVQYEPLSEDLRQRLVDFYSPDVENLGRMIGTDLSGWLNGRAVRSRALAAPV
jgi:hypothetical protein